MMRKIRQFQLGRAYSKMDTALRTLKECARATEMTTSDFIAKSLNRGTVVLERSIARSLREARRAESKLGAGKYTVDDASGAPKDVVVIPHRKDSVEVLLRFGRKLVTVTEVSQLVRKYGEVGLNYNEAGSRPIAEATQSGREAIRKALHELDKIRPRVLSHQPPLFDWLEA